MDLNKVMLIGNITQDPEVRTTPSGISVTSFGLATNLVWTDQQGQKQEKAEFHNIVAFGRTAEVIAQYMKKGRPLFVEGRIQTRSWDDKESGKKNYRTEIVVDNFQFGADGGKGGSGAGAPRAGQEEQPAPNDGEAIKYPDEEINPEDIPF